MFEMLRGEYSYCAGSAQIRLNAMNLIRDVPEVEAKIEAVEMSLTVAANVQSFLRLEKKNARPYSVNAKIELVETVKEISFHVPEPTSTERIKYASEFHRHETNRKRSRYITASANHSTLSANCDLGCAYTDAKTGKRCGSRFQLQRDHIHGFALGGSNEPENLRLLCAQHNRWRNRPVPLIKADHPAYG